MKKRDEFAEMDKRTAEWLNLTAHSADKNQLWNLLDLLPSDSLQLIAETAGFILVDRALGQLEIQAANSTQE